MAEANVTGPLVGVSYEVAVQLSDGAPWVVYDEFPREVEARYVVEEQRQRGRVAKVVRVERKVVP